MRRTIELRQFAGAVAVAEELHFGRAARRVHLTQPALSMLIARLERDLGVRLFDRDHRRVSVTAAGERFVTEARAALVQAEAAVAAVGGTGRRILRVGQVPCADYTNFPLAVRRFGEMNPGVELRVTTLNGAEVERALTDGRIDAAFFYLPLSAAGYRVHRVWSGPLRVVLTADHPLARSPAPAAVRLAAEPFVLFPPESAPHLADRVRAAWAVQGWRPAAVHLVDHPQTALGMVEAGVGLTILPDWIARRAPAALAFRPLPGPDVTADVGLAVPKRGATRLARGFVRTVLDTLGVPE